MVAYRHAPRIERNVHRLKGRPLGLRPLYVQREDHTIGLVRLLSLAVRVLTLIEDVARAALQTTDSAVTGLYAGNPTRARPRPTAERLLTAFQGLTLRHDIGDTSVPLGLARFQASRSAFDA